MIYPMFAMIILTFGYGFYTAYTRVKAAKSGEVNVRYFKTMSGYEVPNRLQITTRHFANLMETPPLFYIAGALIIALGVQSAAAEILGWLYVTARIVHMIIHNGYNNPLHRMMTFFAGLFCILGLWVIVLLNTAAQ